MKKPSTRQPRTPTSSNPPPRKQNVRCKYCSRRIQYRDSLSNSVLVLNKDYIHKRCRKELDGSRPLTRLEQKHLKLHSEFVQCNLCKMIIDKSNDAMHVIKCVKHQIDTERYAQWFNTRTSADESMVFWHDLLAHKKEYGGNPVYQLSGGAGSARSFWGHALKSMCLVS